MPVVGLRWRSRDGPPDDSAVTGQSGVGIGVLPNRGAPSASLMSTQHNQLASSRCVIVFAEVAKTRFGAHQRSAEDKPGGEQHRLGFLEPHQLVHMRRGNFGGARGKRLDFVKRLLRGGRRA